MPRVRLDLLALWGLACVTACDHSVPFTTGGYGAEGPFAGPPEMSQLTVAGASGPAWTPRWQGDLLRPTGTAHDPSGSRWKRRMGRPGTPRSGPIRFYSALRGGRSRQERPRPRGRGGGPKTSLRSSVAISAPLQGHPVVVRYSVSSERSPPGIIGIPLHSDSSGIPVVPSSRMSSLAAHSSKWTVGDSRHGGRGRPEAKRRVGLQAACLRSVITAGATHFTQLAGTRFATIRNYGKVRGASAIYSGRMSHFE